MCKERRQTLSFLVSPIRDFDILFVFFCGYFSTKKQQKIEKQFQFVTSAKTHRLTPPPTQTAQTHSNRHNNTTVYQIMCRASSHDGPVENPCTWLIQNPQKRHSWDWQHHLRVKTERRGGDREEERRILRDIIEMYLEGGGKAKKWNHIPLRLSRRDERNLKEVEGQTLNFRDNLWWKTCYNNRLIFVCLLQRLLHFRARRKPPLSKPALKRVS